MPRGLINTNLRRLACVTTDGATPCTDCHWASSVSIGQLINWSYVSLCLHLPQMMRRKRASSAGKAEGSASLEAAGSNSTLC